MCNHYGSNSKSDPPNVDTFCDCDSADERSGSISRPEAKILTYPLISIERLSSLDSSVGRAVDSGVRGPGFKSRQEQF